ncbi:MAG: transglycosylase domain-containing protein [Hominimerdicola sp.]
MEDTKRKVPKKRKKKKTSTGAKIAKIVGTIILSMFLIIIITCSIFATVLTIYVLNFADTTTTVSLDKVVDSNISRFLSDNLDYEEGDDESEQYELYYAIKNPSKKVIWVDLENVPQYVQDAFVYTEDERFYSHDGVDFKRTFGAFVNIFVPIYGSKQGGSTITQQTIKNITGDDAADGMKGVERKIREIFRTINVEKTYTKEDILQSYLNVIWLGTNTDDITGVQAAANFYFGKDVSDLSLAEAASLAGMTTSPAVYNPLKNPEGNRQRQLYCLNHMLENGAISEQEYNEAVAEELVVVGNYDYSSDTVYDEETEEQGPTSYFMDAAINEAIQIIADNSGISYEDASTRLYEGGYTVYTTVDREMQEKVEKEMQDASNFRTYSFDDDTLWSGFIAMDYQGNVKAVVGGRNEKTESRVWNIATDSVRSPGSTIKPIASYAPALDQDLITWSTISTDEPITIEEEGKNVKWPVNYSETGGDSNWSYNNMFTWQFLDKSLNTLPAQLIKKMTPAYSYNFLKESLDFTTLVDADANYSPVTVGGFTKGVKLEELVGAYMIFGNGGKKYDVSYVYKIENAAGTVIYEKGDGYKQAISESTAYVMNRMLQGVINHEDGTGRYAKLSKTDLVGKTGTTTDWNDLTFVGCTPDYVSGIWIGYENQETIPTNKYQNIGAIWKNIFGDIANNEEHKNFDKMPESVVQLKYCTKTGLIASDHCYSTETGYYKQSNVPGYCSGNH